MSRYEELVTEATKAYRASKPNKKNDLSDYIPSLSDAVSVLIHDRDRYKAKVEALERAIRGIGIYDCDTCIFHENKSKEEPCNECINKTCGKKGTYWQFDEARFSPNKTND